MNRVTEEVERLRGNGTVRSDTGHVIEGAPYDVRVIQHFQVTAAINGEVRRHQTIGELVGTVRLPLDVVRKLRGATCLLELEGGRGVARFLVTSSAGEITFTGGIEQS